MKRIKAAQHQKTSNHNKKPMIPARGPQTKFLQFMITMLDADLLANPGYWQLHPRAPTNPPGVVYVPELSYSGSDKSWSINYWQLT